MHGISQVVQQLASKLALILLLDPAQNRGVRRGRDGRRKAGFQIPSPLAICPELSPRLGSSPTA
jgi:hypothetical protein